MGGIAPPPVGNGFYLRKGSQSREHARHGVAMPLNTSKNSCQTAASAMAMDSIPFALFLRVVSSPFFDCNPDNSGQSYLRADASVEKTFVTEFAMPLPNARTAIATRTNITAYSTVVTPLSSQFFLTIASG